MPTPGLMFVTSSIKDPSKTTDEQYNRFYDEEHLPDVLNYPHFKICDVAKRYKNINPDSQIPYLALYPVEDSAFLTSPKRQQMVDDTRFSKILGNGDRYDFVNFSMRPYEKIQTYEGIHLDSSSDSSTHAQTLICVAMEPAEGQDQDLDDWYRKQHLDMMAMVPHYRRTTRYQRVDGVKPRFLALHEYNCRADELPRERAKLSETEWSKKVLGGCVGFEREVFGLIGVQGDKGLQL